jgi:hypothetical protein
LCGAEYAEDELQKRLNDATRGLVRDESEHVRAQIQTGEADRQELVARLRSLNVLQQYTKTDKSKMSVETAVRMVSAGREQLAKVQAELDATRNTIKTHQDRGWTFGRLVELSTIAGVPEPRLMDRARDAARSEQKMIVEALEKLDAVGAGLRAQLSEVRVRLGLEDGSPADLLRFVATEKHAAEEQRDALNGLRAHMDLRQGAISEVETRLREAQQVAVRLRTALAKETQDADYISRESKLLRDAVAEIAGLRVKLKRVDSAVAVLQDLLSRHSERVLADTVLRENASRIASTFAKIHAPNEFDLVVNDGLKIMRRGGGPVNLDEMSSGQRAAYALSLFIAMNERLRTGPKVILFDDPVAHVDDINTLSLLDHLRDIALTGQRQIFFATADSKIGGLFGRKFRFLGDEFKQIELTRDDVP